MKEEDAPSSAFLAGILGLPGYFIHGTPKILLICIVALILSILMIGKYCDKYKDRKGIIFLSRGASALSFTIILFLEGICVMLYIVPDGKILYTTVLVILVYIIVMISYIFLMKHLIKKGAFRENG